MLNSFDAGPSSILLPMRNLVCTCEHPLFCITTSKSTWGARHVEEKKILKITGVRYMWKCFVTSRPRMLKQCWTHHRLRCENCLSNLIVCLRVSKPLIRSSMTLCGQTGTYTSYPFTQPVDLEMPAHLGEIKNQDGRPL